MRLKDFRMKFDEQVGTSNVIELRYLGDTVTVGCPVSYYLYAKSQLYNIELEPDFNSTCDGCALNETYVVPSCSSDPSLTCCGNGKCDGFETGIS